MHEDFFKLRVTFAQRVIFPQNFKKVKEKL